MAIGQNSPPFVRGHALVPPPNGMVQAWVGQITRKHNFLQVFMMSYSRNIYGDNWLMKRSTQRLL